MKMTNKFLSFVLAFALVITAVLVPATVTASAVGTSHNSFYLDFSNDATAFAANTASTDEDGNTFYPLKYNSSASNKASNVTTELVTLTDGDGVQHSMLKLTSEVVTTNATEIDLIFTDKNGKPFILDANSSYNVEYKMYIQSSAAGKVNFGGGVPATLISRYVPGKETTADIIFGTRKNYAWSMTYNSGFGVTANTYLADGTYGSETGIFTLKDGSKTLNILKTTNTDANWYAKAPSGTLEFKTDNEERTNNMYEIKNTTSGYALGVQSYFAMHFKGITDNNVTKAVYYIDEIKVTKVVSYNVTFNGNGGTVNGSETEDMILSPESALPTAYNENSALTFGGWFDADGNKYTEVSENINGKTLYARWLDKGDRRYDFDHNEILRSNPEVEAYTDKRGITVGDNTYYVNSYSFAKMPETMQTVGKGGSAGLLATGGGDKNLKTGGYLFNDGTSFCTLKPGTSYKVEMDVKVNSLTRLSAQLGYNFYYDNTKYVWASVSANKFAKIHCGYIIKPVVTGLDIDGNEITSTSSYQYKDADGEYVTANLGEWVHIVLTFTTVSEFAEAEVNYPLPDVLGIDMNITPGSEVVFDNVSVEENKIKLNPNGGTVNTFKAFYGDEVELPEPKNANKNMSFTGWFDENGALASTVTAGKEPQTFTAHWTVRPALYTFLDENGNEIGTFSSAIGNPVVFPTPVPLDATVNCFLGWFNENGEEITEAVIGESDVTLTARFGKWGDTNVDGTVDARDIVRLAKHLAGNKVQIGLKQADVDASGTVDVTDLIRFKKYFAGIKDVVLGKN